jgi:AcrR family transcriptional regulator
VRLPAEERRKQILDSAQQVFFERGSIGTRTRDIAERAGITEPFFYRFFATKDEIYTETILEPLDELVSGLQLKAKALVESGESFSPAALESVHVLVLDFVKQAAPFLAVALFSDLSTGRGIYQTEIYPKLRDSVVGVIDALSAGRMARYDPDLLFTMMFGVHLGVSFDHLLRDVPIDVERTAAEITRIYTSGMREELRGGSARRSESGKSTAPEQDR